MRDLRDRLSWSRRSNCSLGIPVGLNGLHRSLLGKVSIASRPFRVLARLLGRPLSFPFIVSSGCPKVDGLLTVEYGRPCPSHLH
jgi:hypothetical protein